jgi:hypothetical protein
MEFIEFQNTDFYNKMSTHLEQFINEQGHLDKDAFKGLMPIIEEFTGFSNIGATLTIRGNLGVDVAYFSPNNVLNGPYVDELLGSSKTTLYRWFKENQVKLFKGAIDYRTGKVEGSFKTVPVKLEINYDLSVTFPADKIAKFGVPLHGILAGAIAHELGHIFGGCMMLLSVCSDNLLAKAALRFYKDSINPEDRVVVLKDVASVLDLPPAKVTELQKLAQDPDEKALLMYFNKMVSQRNSQRSLSVGVEKMTSEVVADMYAIRMGCDKGVIAAISILTDTGCIETVISSLLVATMTTLVSGVLTLPTMITLALSGMGVGGFLTIGMFIFVFSFVIDYFGKGYSGIYNSDPRRLEDAMRQLISKMKEDRRVDAKAKAELIEQVDALLVLVKLAKPWYDSTSLQRFVGWVFSQSDFKLAEIEHYTQGLANHELNLLSHKLKALA